MSISVTGDTHGTFEVEKFSNLRGKLNEDNYIVELDDFGICWDNDGYDSYTREFWGHFPCAVLFIDGNHENFTLRTIIPWKSGTAAKPIVSVREFSTLRAGRFLRLRARYFSRWSARQVTTAAGFKKSILLTIFRLFIPVIGNPSTNIRTSLREGGEFRGKAGGRKKFRRRLKYPRRRRISKGPITAPPIFSPTARLHMSTGDLQPTKPAALERYFARIFRLN